MRALAIGLAVLALGAIAYFAFGRGGDGPVDSGDTPREELRDPAKSDPFRGKRTGVTNPTENPAENPPTKGDAGKGEPEKTAPPPPKTARLVIAPFDRPANGTLTAFRYVLEQTGAPRRAATVQATELALDLPRGAKLRLVVEADGYEPSAPVAFEMPTDRAEHRVRVPLEPASRGSGVELRLWFADRKPVARIEVELRTWEPALPDDPGKHLWLRRAARDDGVYGLPGLKPGSYWLIAKAVDEDGAPTPHVPLRETLTFGGNENIKVTRDLEDGALIELTVVDAAGAKLGDDVAVALHDVHGDPVDMSWRCTIDDKVRVRRGGLPGAVACLGAHAVTPGFYKLLVQRGAGGPVEQQLNLAKGKRAITVRLAN